MAALFISYRQDDAKAWALLLRDRLAAAFGASTVFLDKDGLAAGPWRAQLGEALAGCRVMLVVIGPHWLTAADAHGRRLDQPDDVHRHEIALALAQPGLTVIPVRVDGATLPSAADLPADLRPLLERQSRSVSDGSGHRELDLAQLVADIRRVSGLVPVDTPRPAAHGWRLLRRGGLALLAAWALLVGAEIGLGWRLGPQERGLVIAIVVGLTLLARRY